MNFGLVVTHGSPKDILKRSKKIQCLSLHHRFTVAFDNVLSFRVGAICRFNGRSADQNCPPARSVLISTLMNLVKGLSTKSHIPRSHLGKTSTTDSSRLVCSFQRMLHFWPYPHVTRPQGVTHCVFVYSILSFLRLS